MILPADRRAWPPKFQELFSEPAAIIEYMANLSRETAEYRADIDIRKLAQQERSER